ncbi:MAG: glycerol-3-phosphate dehydrogenase [Roseovarius sp.]|nr:glycerol-3-phosphate dehydrogenase [Roseovarius sp.]
MSSARPACDLFIVGGGVNGCGIARDAAGRGLSVCLAEAGDLAGATSSASTKLFHGGLRYLEYFELRLVREGLAERERLWRAMPHISRPMRFVLPLCPKMRFDDETPAARLLGWAMPWLRGRRPVWLIRAGLWLYDHMGGRGILPGTRALSLAGTPEGAPLQARMTRAFEYSDCWVDDARLVALNARDAAERGAEVLTRHRLTEARRERGLWRLTLEDSETGARRWRSARALVNAAGPWAGEVAGLAGAQTNGAHLRLVRGSHIVVRRLYDHDKCYFLQGRDGRIVFTIPFEEDFTLIGTTDADHPDPDVPPVCTEAEARYLCAFVSDYFRRPVRAEEIVWRFSGVRPLYDDGATSATAATRDYVLRLEAGGDGDAPLLNVFGGKITTYRRLAEKVLEQLAPHLGAQAGPWTAGAPLPGGDFAVDGAARLVADLAGTHPFLDARSARRLVRAYGTEARQVLAGARHAADLGRDFGAGLFEREVRWLMEKEFARTAEDVVWRRSKLGLRMSAAEIAALETWMRERA